MHISNSIYDFLVKLFPKSQFQYLQILWNISMVYINLFRLSQYPFRVCDTRESETKLGIWKKKNYMHGIWRDYIHNNSPPQYWLGFHQPPPQMVWMGHLKRLISCLVLVLILGKMHRQKMVMCCKRWIEKHWVLFFNISQSFDDIHIYQTPHMDKTVKDGSQTRTIMEENDKGRSPIWIDLKKIFFK